MERETYTEKLGSYLDRRSHKDYFGGEHIFAAAAGLLKQDWLGKTTMCLGCSYLRVNGGSWEWGMVS